MVRFKMALAVACSTLALGTAAHAQFTVTPSGDNVIGFQDHDNSVGSGTNTFTDGSTAGAHYTSTFSVTNSQVSFEGGNVVNGQVFASSVSRIDLTVTNSGAAAIDPTFNSQITPAGMGFYLGNNTGGACFASPASCPQTHTLDTFASLSSTNPPFSGGATYGSVSVDFQVLQDGVQIRDIASGRLTMGEDPNGNLVITPDLANLSFLNGFTSGGLTQFGNPGSALGYAWDATDISVNLANPIAAGGMTTLSYIVTVTSETQGNCLTDNVCLVGYAGMGDPIGRGGDISSQALGRFNFSGAPTAPFKFINGVNFSPFSFAPPGFDSQGNIVLSSNGVPEPATWVSMILGFGLLGAALRRRRLLAYT